MPGLAPKELDQLHVGNTLLQFTLDMAVVAVAVGALGLIEHPDVLPW